MKHFKFSKRWLLLVSVIIVLASCEKENIQQETVQLSDEGFRSKTGNNDQELGNLEQESTKPLLHMHFDEGIDMKMANAQWDKAVKDFISKQPVQDKAFSTEWFYRVWTFTGKQSNNDTDGDVGTYVRFTTSAGNYNPPFNWMDNFGDDREGGWDAYLFKASFPGRAVEWVEVDGATLYLKGEDGWFVTDFVIQLWTSDQTLPATGFSGFWSEPNVWLDSINGDTWDSFNSGNIGTGRINF